jgi:hypothetical protein
MGIEEGDKKPNAKLSSIAQAIEDFVDSYTNRKLEATRYLTNPDFCYYDGNGKNYLYLKAYPISYVSSVNIDGDRTFSSGTLYSSGDYYWYPSGKLRLTSGSAYYDNNCGGFYRGRRNILVDFTAGFAPIVGGTHNMAVSTYPIPYDLKQVMVEMCVESFKEGMTAVHTVQPGQGGGDPKFIQMLSRNSFWSNVLNKYKAFDLMFDGRDE